MAINGSFYGKTGNTAIKPKITWEAVADEQGNYSDVTATLTYSRKDGYTTSGHWAGTLTIDGNTKSRSGHYMVITRDSNTLAITHTVRVPHKDNGSRRVTISATGSIPDTTLTKTTITGEVDLETIPRAASIAASDGDIGSTVMVTIGKKSEVYRYVVDYTFGKLRGFVTEDGLSDQRAHTQAACLAFPIPESFYEQIPAQPTGQCTLTCTTYMGDTQISTPRQTAFTVRANPDRCGPLVDGTVIDCNPVTLALTGDETRLIRGESTALCRMEAQARCDAVLTQKKIGNTDITELSLEIPRVEGNQVRFWVQDSRGYTAQEIVEVPMIPYFPPTVRMEAKRTDPVSGDGLLTARGTFYRGSFGRENNTLFLRWRLNDGAWQEAEAVLEDNTFTCTADISNMDYTRSHRITLEVTDQLNSAVATADIQPGIPVFDWGKDDFAFHVPVTVQGVQILQELLRLKETAVKRTGDTMEGTLDMDMHPITGLPQPTGETDGVPKNYADRKLEIRMLWRNRVPEQAFQPQTIGLELADADGVSILYKNESTGTLHMNTGFIPKDCKSRLSYLSQSSGKRSERKFTAYDSGVVFEDGSYSDGTSANIHGVPVAIYGWYGVMHTDTKIAAVCGNFRCGEVLCGQ